MSHRSLSEIIRSYVHNPQPLLAYLATAAPLPAQWANDGLLRMIMDIYRGGYYEEGRRLLSWAHRQPGRSDLLRVYLSDGIKLARFGVADRIFVIDLVREAGHIDDQDLHTYLIRFGLTTQYQIMDRILRSIHLTVPGSVRLTYGNLDDMGYWHLRRLWPLNGRPLEALMRQRNQSLAHGVQGLDALLSSHLIRYLMARL